MTDPIVKRLKELVRKHDQEVRTDVLIRFALGVLFSVFTFGFVYWVGWVFGFMVAYQFGIEPWQFAAGVTALFFAVATWSAWARVDPLAGVRSLTERQQMEILIAQAVGLRSFSPRHALAGFATALIGGPLNLVQALSAWNSRIRWNDARMMAAADLLDSCRKICPIEAVRNFEAAVILRRLTLVKLVPLDLSYRVALTEKGEKLLRMAEKSASKKSKARDK